MMTLEIGRTYRGEHGALRIPRKVDGRTVTYTGRSSDHEFTTTLTKFAAWLALEPREASHDDVMAFTSSGAAAGVAALAQVIGTASDGEVV